MRGYRAYFEQRNKFYSLELVATEDAARAQWWPIDNLPALAFDHAEIYTTALASLKEAVTLFYLRCFQKSLL